VKWIGRLFLALSTLLGLLPALVWVRMRVAWQAECAGGRDARPDYDVNDCGDLEAVLVISATLAALLLAPLVIYGLARISARNRARRNRDQG